jgi:hypothetical protein
LQRIDGDRAFHLTCWRTLEALAVFARPDIKKAKQYREGKELLLEFEQAALPSTVAERPG